MINIRIVCAHDGVDTAQALARLLAAEQYGVDICYGRASLDHLPAARAKREAVILIWSLDAPSALYMLQWAQAIDPTRLVEILRAKRLPPLPARASTPLDFTSWNGARGGTAWRALIERLRTIARALEPPKPPPVRAAMALGAVSMLAVGGAVFERLHAPDIAPRPATENLAETTPIVSTDLPEEGRGGSLLLEEPASYVEDAPPRFGPFAPRIAPLAAARVSPLIEPQIAPPEAFREATLMQRLAAFANQRSSAD